MRLAFLVVALAAVVSGEAVYAGVSNKEGTRSGSSDKALLGAPGFYPSPEHPVGWRGDGTGNYPGATPPLHWARRMVGATDGMTCQAAKPKTGDAQGGQPLMYGQVRQWILLGPFPGEDATNALNATQIKETEVQPADGDKEGSLQWKTAPPMASDWAVVNIAQILKAGDMKEAWAAYLHSYLYARSNGKVAFQVLTFFTYGEPMFPPTPKKYCLKVWLNGKETPKGSDALDVAAGWNRLLIKVAYPPQTKPVQTEFAFRIKPVDPISFRTENILWMTPILGDGVSQPVPVGDKIFLGSSMIDLYCINKADGKILWMRGSTVFNTLTEAERAKPEMAEARELAAKLGQMEEKHAKDLSDLVSPEGIRQDREKPMRNWATGWHSARRNLGGKLVEAVRKVYPDRHCGFASSAYGLSNTSCTDGNFVYFVNAAMGLITCFDMNGNFKWGYADKPREGSYNAHHYSPMIVNGKVIYTINGKTTCLDGKSGAVVWQKKHEGFFYGCGSLVSVQIDKKPAVFLPFKPTILLDAADGTVLWESADNAYGTLPWTTPVLQNGVLYGTANYIHGSPDSVIAYKLPGRADEKFSMLYRKPLDLKPVMTEQQHGGYAAVCTGSPVYLDGLLYCLAGCGYLSVVDAQSGDIVYRKALDMNVRGCNKTYGYCASTAAAGKNVFLQDDSGTTLILEGGREYKEVARNFIETGTDQVFWIAPVFDGDRIYLRIPGYLVCIAEKKTR